MVTAMQEKGVGKDVCVNFGPDMRQYTLACFEFLCFSEKPLATIRSMSERNAETNRLASIDTEKYVH